MPFEGLVVTRPKLGPVKLRRLAKRARKTEKQFLVDLISRHATFEDARAEVGVSRETFRLWRREFGIEVVREGAE